MPAFGAGGYIFISVWRLATDIIKYLRKPEFANITMVK
jgi:hypothetical protein